MEYLFLITTLICSVVIAFLYYQNKNLKIQLHKTDLENTQNLEKYIKLSTSLKQITHQWRQPLNAISLGIQELQIIHQLQSAVTNDDLNRFSNESNAQIKYISQAIDNIKKCFNEQIELKTYSIKEIIQNTTNCFIDKHFTMNGNDFNVKLDASFKEILEGLISAIKDDNITFNINKTIQMQSSKHLGDTELNSIFKPSFLANKEQNQGYEPYIGKIIIEQLYNGNLKAYNNDVGFVFEIDLNI